MPTRRLTLSLAAFVLCAWAAAGDAPKPTPASSEINELLAPVREKHEVPALAAAVVNSKGLVAVGAVGARKLGDKTAVTVDDQFHLGSDTKAMTAALIAGLVEEGKLSYDDTLAKLFPGRAKSLHADLRPVTLAQLLTHHAGLPRDLKSGWRDIDRERPVREQRDEVLARVAPDKPERAPGKEFYYSNLGYVLAGHVAEKAAGAPWEELIQQRLFRPLGMKSAGFGAMGTPKKVDQPWQHLENGWKMAPSPYSDNPPVMGPAGTVHCSLPDWARFIADELRGARGGRGLLKPGTYKMLLAEAPYPDHFYTLGGWGGRAKDERAGGPLLQHDGSNNMSHAAAWVAPRRDLAVLVVTNQGGDKAAKACHEARDLLLGKYLKPR
jgi:CubicO group peptidase (beta-lactamase class C family)